MQWPFATGTEKPMASGRGPLRVFAVFALGILVPAGILSFFGFRAFQYESMLLAKRAEENYAATAALILQKSDEAVRQWVDVLTAAVRGAKIDGMDRGRLQRFVLDPPALGGLQPTALFVFDLQERMRSPWDAASERVSDAHLPRRLEWGSLRDEIERLEALEFGQKRTAEAVEGYAALLSLELPSELQATLLKNIAAGRRKLGQEAQAETLYRRLADKYDGVIDVSGLPTGILARQLLADLYERKGLLTRAAETQMEIAEGIMADRWPLSAAQQEALIRHTDLAVDRCLKAGHSTKLWSDWTQLQMLRSRLQENAIRGKSFYDAEWPALLKRLRKRGWLEQGGVLVNGGHFAVVAPLTSAGQERRAGLLVALLPAPPLWRRLEAVSEDLARPVGMRVQWENGAPPKETAAAGQWAPVMDRAVEALDPPVRLQLLENRSLEQNHLARRRQWIYGGMVALSLLVILVGLYVMGQAVRRETELANLKAGFVATVSHELRTPLAAISHIGERLNLGRYRSEEERKEFYGLLSQETDHLRKLIEEILDFSKILAGKKSYRQEPLDLDEVVKEAVEAFQGKADAEGFEIVCNVPPGAIPIRGDHRAIVQAVLNLLDNAVKYSGASRRIDVRTAVQGPRALVSVQDFGIGIEARDVERIFDKFYRVERVADNTAGGVGLGLAMVKHVAEGHGGAVRVESRPDQGSVFSLEFPLAAHSEGRSSTA